MPDENLILSEIKKSHPKVCKRRYCWPRWSFYSPNLNVKLNIQVWGYIEGPRQKYPAKQLVLLSNWFDKKRVWWILTGIHKFKASQNTLVVIPARIITSSRNWSLDMEGYFICSTWISSFKITFLINTLKAKNIKLNPYNPYIHLTDEQAKKLRISLRRCLKKSREMIITKTSWSLLKIIELLILSERLFEDELHLETNLPTIDIIKRFIDLLEVNFSKERSVGFYAKQLNVHPNHLNSLIKSIRALPQRNLFKTGFFSKQNIYSIQQIFQ